MLGTSLFKKKLAVFRVVNFRIHQNNRSLTGHVSCDLLQIHIPGIHNETVPTALTPHAVLAGVPFQIGPRMMLVVDGLSRAVVMVPLAHVVIVVVGLGATVEKDADAAVLADPIGDFFGINPKSQLVGKKASQAGLVDSAGSSSFGYDGVHLVVNSDAAITRSLTGRIGKPVLLVMMPQHVF